jgi:hypothetical protein
MSTELLQAITTGTSTTLRALDRFDGRAMLKAA